MTTRLLSEVRFASLLNYSPRGETDLEARSRRVRDNVKRDLGGVLALAAQRIQERWDELPFADFLGSDFVLIPAPRSAPLSPGALWPSMRICEELFRRKLGRDITPCLERTSAVPKSAFAGKGERTRAQAHFDSLRAIAPLLLPEHRVITIVDDVVTTGAMLLACASHVSLLYPGSKIHAFGLLRPSDEMVEILAPCAGRISLVAGTGETRRRP